MCAIRTTPPNASGLRQIGVSAFVIADPPLCLSHVFEKSLILKQLSLTGQCPVTGQNLDAATDLVDLKVANHVSPKPLSTMSFPGMLKFLQEQWDT